MGHWQVLALKIAGLWAENAQDMIYQDQSNLVIRKRKGFYLNKDFLNSSPPLGIWRSNQGQTLPPVSSKAGKAWVCCGKPGH
jgi:hypothetical protein